MWEDTPFEGEDVTERDVDDGQIRIPGEGRAARQEVSLAVGSPSRSAAAASSPVTILDTIKRWRQRGLQTLTAR